MTLKEVENEPVRVKVGVADMEPVMLCDKEVVIVCDGDTDEVTERDKLLVVVRLLVSVLVRVVVIDIEIEYVNVAVLVREWDAVPDTVVEIEADDVAVRELDMVPVAEVL